jgi:hypothetical protein
MESAGQVVGSRGAERQATRPRSLPGSGRRHPDTEEITVRLWEAARPRTVTVTGGQVNASVPRLVTPGYRRNTQGQGPGGRKDDQDAWLLLRAWLIVWLPPWLLVRM